MQISKIYSTRRTNNEVYSDLIFEWEDDYSKYLNAPIYSFNKSKEKYIRHFFKVLFKLNLSNVVQYIDKLRNSKSLTLVFELYPRSYFSFQVFSNKIPFIIDFDYNVDLKNFYFIYRNCKLILISSLEAFNYLLANNCPLNIVHFPLSISDKYKLDIKSVKDKEFDVIVVRSNNVFMDYLERYANKYPDFEYVVRRWEGTQLYRNNVYFSNKKGIIGEFSERSSYLDLLKKAKVALYATPGFDDNKKRFMNHVTPSLFELISSGCRIIARYPNNFETSFFNLEKISPNVNNYETFEVLLSKYIKDTSFNYLKDSEKFLEPIYTKSSVENLKKILNK